VQYQPKSISLTTVTVYIILSISVNQYLAYMYSMHEYEQVQKPQKIQANLKVYAKYYTEISRTRYTL